MFLINNEKFTKLTKELEESMTKLEECRKIDYNYVLLDRFVLDRKIKVYQSLIDEALYLSDDIIRVLKVRLDYFKRMQSEEHFFEINRDK